jgi:hypothetical protein
MTSGIYKIKLGPRRYVGQARDIKRRWEQHRQDLADRCHHNKDLQRIYNQGYRPKFSIVCHCPRWQLDALEAGWGRLLSNTQQRLPRLRPTSFLPAFHPATLIDWALIGVAIALLLATVRHLGGPIDLPAQLLQITGKNQS